MSALLVGWLYAAGPACHAQESFPHAVVLLQSGRFQEAEVMLRKRVRRLPKDLQAHSMLGIALAQQGNLAEAVMGR